MKQNPGSRISQKIVADQRNRFGAINSIEAKVHRNYFHVQINESGDSLHRVIELKMIDGRTKNKVNFRSTE
ncbi:hypothetical protein CWD77_00765 [Rhodohalobacter barkolensis]|uniref:Uncharacterized protein n=1 Tax=Rhodohalobacter barkolensis TaxID=2053187 RepID=A0A2N0VIN1_9BACT|nr:hypothetical protein CWD77_00765 [Rhodohalobacter barkolensis]